MKCSPVAPFVGAWIEIYLSANGFLAVSVAPFVGAWIEMSISSASPAAGVVAPFVGAWIEIDREAPRLADEICRSVRRSVY